MHQDLAIIVKNISPFIFDFYSCKLICLYVVFLCFFFEGINVYNCLTSTHMQVKAVLLAIVADQDAKTYIQNMKGHRGYDGCSYCTIHGIYYMRPKFV